MWKSRFRRRLCFKGKPARDGEGRAQEVDHAQGSRPCVVESCNKNLV